MRTTQYSILVGYAGITEKGGKYYSYASTATMLRLLCEFTGVAISRSTFFKHTRALKKEGLIKVIRRYGRRENGEIYNRTSAVCITIKGYAVLAARGVKWALSMIKKLRKKLTHEKPEQRHEITKTCKAEENKEAEAVNKKDWINYNEPIYPQLIQSELFNKSIEAAKKAGLSLYDFLRNKKKPESPLHGSVKATANKT